MRIIVALLIISCLTGCSAARKAVGAVSNLGSKTEAATNAEASAANAEASSASRGITQATDMGKVAKQVPNGLVSDTKNSLHSGDAIAPQ
jgi:hypothetical protein